MQRLVSSVLNYANQLLEFKTTLCGVKKNGVKGTLM